jgi:hypothetical protein
LSHFDKGSSQPGATEDSKKLLSKNNTLKANVITKHGSLNSEEENKNFILSEIARPTFADAQLKKKKSGFFSRIFSKRDSSNKQTSDKNLSTYAKKDW